MSVFASKIIGQLILKYEKEFVDGVITDDSVKLHREAFKEWIGRYPEERAKDESARD